MKDDIETITEHYLRRTVTTQNVFCNVRTYIQLLVLSYIINQYHEEKRKYFNFTMYLPFIYHSKNYYT